MVTDEMMASSTCYNPDGSVLEALIPQRSVVTPSDVPFTPFHGRLIEFRPNYHFPAFIGSIGSSAGIISGESSGADGPSIGVD